MDWQLLSQKVFAFFSPGIISKMVNSSFQAEYDNLNMKELLFGAIL